MRREPTGWRVALLVCIAASTASAEPQGTERPPRVVVPAGKLLPFFAPRPPQGVAPGPRRPIEVPAFELDTAPVTNAEMLAFVRQHPQWRRSRVARIFAEETYLSHWRGDLELGDPSAQAPVTHVSWFAAEAYCQAQQATLPTTLQWEYALADRGRGEQARRERVLAWYAQPSGQALGPVAQSAANGYGVHDLVGLVWEWTLDFSADMLGSEPRNSGTKEEARFCGAGALGALDPSDYATFMRYSFRASLRARFTTGNLGFRCARLVSSLVEPRRRRTSVTPPPSKERAP